MSATALLGLALGLALGALSSVVASLILVALDRRWQVNMAWAGILLLGAILCAVLRLYPRIKP